MRKLEIVYKPIDEIIPYVNNANTHDQKQINQIKASIKEFGMNSAIALHNNVVVYGHGRLEALNQLGETSIPTVDLSDLTKAQMKAYVIADNQIAKNSGVDIDLMKIEIAGLDDLDFNLDILGFDEDELSVLLDSVNFEPAGEDDQGNLDELDPKYIDCPHCGKEFDMRAAK